MLTGGGSYTSLEASFASVKRHAARFGEAPIKINLREAEVAMPSILPQVPAAQREATIANIDQERARREGLRTRALAAAAAASPGSIVTHSYR